MEHKITILDRIGQKHFDELKSEAEGMRLFGVSTLEMSVDELKVAIGFLIKNSPILVGFDPSKEH